jgi:hypothetical protein
MLTAQRVSGHKVAHHLHNDLKIAVQPKSYNNSATAEGRSDKISFKNVEINNSSFGSQIGYKEILAHFKSDRDLKT